jgi:hypothetical protein
VILGGTVCRMHGGAAPQVKKSAQERLTEMVDPLLTELFRIAQASDSDAVRLAAIKDALDRAGYRANTRLELTGKDGGPIEVASAAIDSVIEQRLAELAIGSEGALPLAPPGSSESGNT